MLVKAIEFDERNDLWCENEQYNLMFLKVQEAFINDVIRAQGYIYLNTVCELLGAKWDPNDDNPYFRKDEYVEFETFSLPENSMIVGICSRKF